VSIFVDGKYQADATILAENPTPVGVNLGVLGAGMHVIEYRDSTNLGDTKGSSSGVTGLAIVPAADSLKQQDIQPDPDQELANRYSPIITLADDAGKNSPSQAVNNTPLLTTARVTHESDGTTKIRYSVIYSNEDGGDGTYTDVLADKWGRTTDDELVYTVTLNAAKEVVTIEGNQDARSSVDLYCAAEDKNHLKLAALQDKGRLRVTIDNEHNQVKWTSTDPDRPPGRTFSGAPVLATGKTTIDVMNDHPWIWKVANKEVLREPDKPEINRGGIKEHKVNPYNRLYFNLNPASSAGYDGSEITLNVMLKDGTSKEISWDPHNPENFSIDLSKYGIGDMSKVSSVQISGLPAGAKMGAQYLKSNDAIVPVSVAVLPKKTG
jgi:hypothetical protein